jgi:hypothetical protein
LFVQFHLFLYFLVMILFLFYFILLFIFDFNIFNFFNSIIYSYFNFSPFFPFLYDYSEIYFIPHLFYFYFFNFNFFLSYFTISSFINICLFGLLPFSVIAAFHTIFSHYSHPAPRATLGYTETSSRTGIRETTFRVSLPPPPPTLFWFFMLLIYSFAFSIFTVGLFVIYLSSFILIFSSFTVTLFHIVFPTLLAVCIPGTPSSYTLFVSTHLSPWFYPIGCHHITHFATPPYFPESTL